MANFWQYSINFVFPKTCVICSKYLPSDDWLSICSDCWDEIRFVGNLYCQKCGIPLPDGGAHCYNCLKKNTKIHYQFLRGVCIYDDPIKRCIHLFKYSGKDYLAKPLSSLLVDYIKTNQQLNNIDLIFPVPLHWRKKFRRGYNQSELLVKEVSLSLNRNLVLGNLYRKKPTKAQVKLNRTERLENVADAFAIKNPESIKDKSVLVIDDVCTTGETINQCAKVLRSAGAKEVYGLTVARDI